MFVLRAMPKHLGTIVFVGFLTPLLLAILVFVYANTYMDTDDLDKSWVNTFNIWGDVEEDQPEVEDPTFRSSLAFKKQQELDQIDEEQDVKPDANEDIKPFTYLTYKESLKRTADKYGYVMIKFCDDGRIDSAINFHETSIVKDEIQNVLYIAPDVNMCNELWKIEVKCHVLEPDFLTFNGTKPINDQDKSKQRAIAKVKLILKALTAGYTILYTDLKTLYLKNPFEKIDCQDTCDVALSVDNVSMNYANFAVQLAKPRRSTVYLYARLLTVLGSHPSHPSKDIFNSILTDMKAKKQISVEYLNAEKFAPASYYFLTRRFDDDKSRCRTCVAVFEDRGIPKADQVYQMKELHLWNGNFDEYYTSRRRMYIVYENVYLYGEKRSVIQELTALRNALAIGQALGRIVILPKFHCPESLFEMKFCSLSDFIKVDYFDEQFGDMYREHTFLEHPKVSREVRRTVTDGYYIGSALPEDEEWDKDADIKPKHKLIYLDPGKARGMTAEELETTFRNEASYNLLFHSLYDGFAGFENKQDSLDFNKKIKNAFKLTSPIGSIIGDKTFELLFY